MEITVENCLIQKLNLIDGQNNNLGLPNRLLQEIFHL